MSKKNIIPVFVPHYGCPNDCVFCNQNKITGSTTDVTPENVKETILEYLSYFRNKNNIEVAFYGGSFTAIDMQTQSLLLNVALEFKNKNLINEIRLSTRPDCIDDEILDNLKKYKVDTIELGVQSLDRSVLELSNRGHNIECVYEASKKIKDFGFNLGLQQMIGLPGDNIDKDIYTASEFIKLNPYCVRIYPTLVIKDTKLESDFNIGLYDSLSIEEAVSRTKEILKLYIKNDINVIRVGLQPTEEINSDSSVVSGPFHPAFRQLVESEIIYDTIVNFFRDISIEQIDTLEILSSGKNISNISGQKGKNKEKIRKALNIKNLKLKEDNIDDNSVKVIYNDKIEIINLKKYM